MLENIKLAWAWLAAGNETLPYLVVTLFFYLLCYAVRKLAPGVWLAIASVFPYADALSKGEDVIRQVFLALPQVVAAALLTGLATNDVKGALLGAIAGAGAPILHHVRAALPFDPYKGKLGNLKPKGGGDSGPTGGTGDGSAPLSVRPPGGTDAEFRRWTEKVQLTGLQRRRRQWRLVLAFAVLPLLLGCAGAAAELKDPCSHLSWTTIEQGCERRIENECVAGDTSCPVFLECNRARTEWEACQ